MNILQVIRLEVPQRWEFTTKSVLTGTGLLGTGKHFQGGGEKQKLKDASPSRIDGHLRENGLELC